MEISRREFIKKTVKNLIGGIAATQVLLENKQANAQKEKRKIEGIGNNGDDFHIPVQGERLKKEQLNFDIFPERLTFKPNKNLLIVSDKWQTACLYDTNGNKMYQDKEKTIPMQFMMSTGKDGHETEYGVYQVWYKEGKHYKSKSYPIATKDRDAGGAEMPWAIKLIKFLGIENDKEKYDEYDGISIHGRPSTIKTATNNILSNSIVIRPSFGCFGSDVNTAELLNKGKDESGRMILRKGDFVVNIYDEVPTATNIAELEAYIISKKNDYLSDKRIKRQEFILPNDGWVEVKP